MKNIEKYLILAGVPQHLHEDAIESLERAKALTSGTYLKKIKARLFYAGKIAKTLRWEDERLCIKYPELAKYDIAPVKNVTCNGDMIPWKSDGSEPKETYWLDKNPDSEEYKEAVKANERYCSGAHPRSRESRKCWYRRNAGEYPNYMKGALINPKDGVEFWRGHNETVSVLVVRASGAWIVSTKEKVLGNFCLVRRTGFEVDNIYCGINTPRMWFPIEGYDLRAIPTHSVLPKIGMKVDQPHRWEAKIMQVDATGKTYANTGPL